MLLAMAEGEGGCGDDGEEGLGRDDQGPVYCSWDATICADVCVKSNMASQAWWQAREAALLVQDT